MSGPEIDLAACRGRQKRLLDVMQTERLDLVVVTRTEHVQWLAGPRFGWMFEVAAFLWADGHLTLVAPSRRPPAVHAADELILFEAQSHSTVRNDQRAQAVPLVRDAIAKRGRLARVGVEFAHCGPHLTNALPGPLVDVDPALFRLRRRKDADELALLQRAIDATGAMYAHAKKILHPGINELEMFNELQAVAVRTLGEMLTGTGNDYQCGSRGGPPRDRIAQAGELYILDLGPAYRGYFADTCRTFAVSGEPTYAQQRAWEAVAEVFSFVENRVKPGKSCKELFEEVQELLDDYQPGIFNHHLGHGIGLFPHEAPHLNPNWDDVFEVGDVFTAEPGLYTPELNVGLRLENDFVVTESGVRLLSDFPLPL